MKITPSLFEANLTCSTKCWLRSSGELSAGNEYAEWAKTETESYRDAGTKRLIESLPSEECSVSPPDTENVKAARWQMAVDHAAQTDKLESRLHAVEREPSEGRGRPAQFIPIRFIYRNKLNRDDKLLVAFDAFVLSEMLEREVSLGWRASVQGRVMVDEGEELALPGCVRWLHHTVALVTPQIQGNHRFLDSYGGLETQSAVVLNRRGGCMTEFYAASSSRAVCGTSKWEPMHEILLVPFTPRLSHGPLHKSKTMEVLGL